MWLWPILVFSIAHALDDGFLDVIPPLLPIFGQRYGLTNAQLGTLILALTIPCNFGQPLFGIILDRHRYRGAASIGLLLALAGVVLAITSTSLLTLAAGLFLTGLGTGIFHPASGAWVGEMGGVSRRAQALSIFGGIGSAGYALGAVAGPIMYKRFGQDGIAWATTLSMLWTLVLLAVERAQHRRQAERSGLAEAWAKKKPLFTVLATTSIRGMAVGAFATFVPLLAKERGYDLIGGGIALWGFLLAGALGVHLGALADRWGRKWLTVVTLLIGGPLLAAGALVPGAVGLALMWTAGLILRSGEPANIAQAQEIVTSGAGMAAGMTMGLSWGIAGLTYPLVGAVADATGMHIALACWAGLCWIAVLPALKMPETMPEQA